ncbi:MAG TPA: ThiF family adenylyltransferase [Armatimonadota bacterium]|jgi:hypothetical protein
MTDGRYSRQSFLGPEAQSIISRTRVGVVGLGGGGSHIGQQLAHIGFVDYVLYDPDIAKCVNLNRTVGTTAEDVAAGRLKLDAATRLIIGLQPDAVIRPHACRWQDQPEDLRGCDIVFGCVDGFRGRDELERSCRRYMIPYVDIGMDVHQADGEAPRMGGQVILSLPGHPCMRCLGFLTNETLAREGEAYGDAGVHPQVVWANGMLASAAVGVGVDLLTDWTRSLRGPVYLSFVGNDGTLTPHVRLQYLDLEHCTHYPIGSCGDVRVSS